jgi:hypothetical protein
VPAVGLNSVLKPIEQMIYLFIAIGRAFIGERGRMKPGE